MIVYSFFATAAKGLETLLADELTQLGLNEVKETRAGVSFTGGLKAAYTACLWSRVANRILLPIAKFPAADTDELYSWVRKVNWARHLSVDQTYAIDASVSHSNINHSKYAALKTKDAIADWFRDREDVRPSVATHHPDIQLNLYINNNEAQLYLDLSGESLHFRGYRTRGSAAPLKENLAAGILYRAKWPEVAAKGGAFVDFMCGSGTLPVEAAMMACDIAPGLGRSYYGFLAWAQHDTKAWQSLLDDAELRKTEGLKRAPTILGFDHHRGTIERANQHIDQAGLNDIVSIVHQDIFDFKQDMPKTGLVVVNPPYGKRLGEEEDIEGLYRQIGKLLKSRFMGWQASMLTDEKSNGKFLGLRAKKLHSLFNGALPVKLLHFDVSEKALLVQYRLPKLMLSEELSEASLGFKNRLKKNRNRLKPWLKKNDIRAYRLYDADLPDYAIAVDVYEADQTLIHVQEYEAPKTIEAEKAKLRLREALTIIVNFFSVSPDLVFLKSRKRQKGQSQYEKLGDEKKFYHVIEGECQFRINLEDYLDTGLFLDHRPMRQRVFRESKSKRVLNLFAYTGSVTVQAAAGGAKETLTVDMSNTYIDWSKQNMALNGFTGNEHRYLQVDCVNWLAHNNERTPFDLIFLDPPSFSNSKRMSDKFDVQTDHVQLIEDAIKLLSDDGVMYFSNNLRGFKLSVDALSDYRITDLTEESVPEDFKQRKHVHRCWKIQKS